MGKPYASELEVLPDTYEFALRAPMDELVSNICDIGDMPLIAVGSGGSLTTAAFAAMLHQEYTGNVANSLTPMEAANFALNYKSVGVLMATAGGKNPDAIGAFKSIVAQEPPRLILLCNAIRSPLSKLAEKYGFVIPALFELPTGKDGFLATNTLLASTVLLTRAYLEAFGKGSTLPSRYHDLIGATPKTNLTARFDKTLSRVLERQTLIVLYGPDTKAAALDLESKFVEAALGNVSIADYRNFAHGRHHWLAKRSSESAVIAFVTPNDEAVASRTLELVPSEIPAVRFDLPFSNSNATLSALICVFHIVGAAGRAKGIDPGRPGVPSFGRRIYHLSAFGKNEETENDMSETEAAAISRKTVSSITCLVNQGQLPTWRKAFRNFIERLTNTAFQGVVFDYDGTLCDEADRYKSLSSLISRELVRLLRAGAVLGIATGRGKSARVSLREAIPKRYWQQVVVGYYNGGDVALLGEDDRPDGSKHVCEELRPVQQALTTHRVLRNSAEFEFRIPQIKVEPKNRNSLDVVSQLLQQLVCALDISGVKVLRSGHSMDVLAPGVSKLAVVNRVSEIAGAEKASEVLCIGDRGQWPGNDFAILGQPSSLSVDEVSPDPETCWNLAPVGIRGQSACLVYLRCLRSKLGKLYFQPDVPKGSNIDRQTR